MIKRKSFVTTDWKDIDDVYDEMNKFAKKNGITRHHIINVVERRTNDAETVVTLIYYKYGIDGMTPL